MKVSITRRVEGRRLREVLPSEVRNRVPTSVKKDSRYTVLLFPHTREDVVRSPEVEKALRRAGTDQQLVAVSGNFTADARAVLAERGAIVISMGDFFWTDESYLAIRNKP